MQWTTTSAARSRPTVARFSLHRKVSPNEFCPASSCVRARAPAIAAGPFLLGRTNDQALDAACSGLDAHTIYRASDKPYFISSGPDT
jgi:hypothetical protein